MRKIAFVILALFLISPIFTPVVAHSTGESFEKKVGDYLVDIGYDPAIFEAGISNTFSFGLVNAQTEEEIDFDYVWVRIEQEGQTDFASGIKKQELGATTMIYTFPEITTYDISVRYQKGDEIIAETSVPINVVKSSNSFDESESLELGNIKFVAIGLIGLIGLIVGAIIAFFVLPVILGRKTR